ncbi:MAG TPA: NAD-dependent epimerase/dehydratase family protein [Myxococcales bacterium]|nr:NAD-dependent epimerase/dehydratase family protein [Myxococcales bacterium]HIN86105.1 NAD-dependent epimerase/dehydratase family protein [Myxococcales bacterium]
MSLTSKSVAILGAGGVVGRALVKSLVENSAVDNILALDTRKPTGLPRSVKCFALDVLADGFVDRLAGMIDDADVGTLIHLGYLSDQPDRQERQTEETQRVVELLTRRPVSKTVFAGTTLVYGALPGDPSHLYETTPIVEEHESKWVCDKVRAEKVIQNFVMETDETITVLRFAPVLGPNIRNFLSEYLYRNAVPTVKGLDPQVQVIHELDAARACELAVEGDYDGIFNIVAHGALPLSVSLRIGRRRSTPVNTLSAYPLTQLLWDNEIVETPEVLLDLFKYLWVADGRKASESMEFHPQRSTREALEDFYRTRAANEAAAAAAG